MPSTRQGYRPCSACGHYGSEWREIGGIRYAVTAPRDVSVKKGEPWTCRLCVRQGHPQKATQSTSDPTLMQ